MSPLLTDHAYKMLSSYLLLRMLKDIEGTITVLCEEPAINDSTAGVMMLILPQTANWKLDSGCVGLKGYSRFPIFPCGGRPPQTQCYVTVVQAARS